VESRELPQPGCQLRGVGRTVVDVALADEENPVARQRCICISRSIGITL
jgi:hypothetical protein